MKNGISVCPDNFAIVYIDIGKKKRSWEKFRDIMKTSDDPTIEFDLRRFNKDNPAIIVECLYCKESLEIYSRKTFPLENVKCKCKQQKYLIKWNEESFI